MQRFHVFIRCPQLPAAHAEYSYKITAGAWHVAVANAIRLFKREPRVQRRHITTLELRATILGVAPAKEEILLPLDGEVQP